MDIAEFLLARIAEEEAEIAAGFDFATLDSSGWMGHAATWGRERARAECDAKRQIVELAHPDGDDEWVLCYLALPYTDHPDYRQEWNPQVTS